MYPQITQITQIGSRRKKKPDAQNEIEAQEQICPELMIMNEESSFEPFVLFRG